MSWVKFEVEVEVEAMVGRSIVDAGRRSNGVGDSDRIIGGNFHH